MQAKLASTSFFLSFFLFISVFYVLGFHLTEEPILAKAEVVRN